MKLHHTEYKKNYRDYILSTITEDGEGKAIRSPKKKIEYIFNRFYEEYDWNIKRHGEHKAMSEWLSGLPFNIDYWYDGIVERAVGLGSIDDNPSDKIKDKVAENYFDFMANIVLSFKRA